MSTPHAIGIFDIPTADAARDLLAVEHLALQHDGSSVAAVTAADAAAASGATSAPADAASAAADAAATLAPSQAGVAVWEALGGVFGPVAAPLADATRAHAAATWRALRRACPALAQSLERAAGGARTLHPINAPVVAAAAWATMLGTYARYSECSTGFAIDAIQLALAAWVVSVYAPRRWQRATVEARGRCPTAAAAEPQQPDAAAVKGSGVQSVYTRWVLELADAWVVLLVLGVWATFLPPVLTVAMLVLYNARLSLPLLAATRLGAAARTHVPAAVAAVALPLLSTSFGVFTAAVGAGAALGYVGAARDMNDGVNSAVLLLAALSVVARPGMALRAVYAVAHRDVDPASRLVSRHVETAWPPRDSECLLRFAPAAVQAAMPPHVAAALFVFALVAAAEARPDLFLHPKMVSAVTLVLVRRVLVPALLVYALALAAALSVALRTPPQQQQQQQQEATDVAAGMRMAAPLQRVRADIAQSALEAATAALAASPPTADPVTAPAATAFAAAFAAHFFGSK